ncbi:MAG: hypothetical protein IPH32_02510 [Bacteroidetes bacterium]|nr:hypothetical protein [Bacteroidota bacterium]
MHKQSDQIIGFNLDATKDNVNGVSTEKTYEELLKGKNQLLLLLEFWIAVLIISMKI